MSVRFTVSVVTYDCIRPVLVSETAPLADRQIPCVNPSGHSGARANCCCDRKNEAIFFFLKTGRQNKKLRRTAEGCDGRPLRYNGGTTKVSMANNSWVCFRQWAAFDGWGRRSRPFFFPQRSHTTAYVTCDISADMSSRALIVSTRHTEASDCTVCSAAYTRVRRVCGEMCSILIFKIRNANTYDSHPFERIGARGEKKW